MDMEALFREEATTAVIRFIEATEVGKKLDNGIKKYDLWDVERLDQNEGEEEMVLGVGDVSQDVLQGEECRRVVSPEAVAP